MVPLSVSHWAIFLIALLAACVLDVLKRRIPNWLTVGMLVAGLSARTLETGLHGGGTGLLGALVGLAVLIVPFAKRWTRGGDVKLLVAIGGWLGPLATLHACLGAGAAGGLLAVYDLLRSRSTKRRDVLLNLRLAFWTRSVPDVEERHKHDKLPYSLALAAGAGAALVLHRGHFGLG